MFDKNKRFRVTMTPLNKAMKPMVFILDEEQLTDMTSTMNYGSGWFEYREYEKTLWLNMHGIASVTVTPIEEEEPE